MAETRTKGGQVGTLAGAVGAVREGGDDVEWVGKALRAVGAEGVWAHIDEGGEWGSVREALKAVWVVGSVGGGGGVANF